MFEWDSNKNIANIENHGVSFQIAIEVFNDKNAYEINRIVSDEVRVKVVGVIDEIILSIVYTIRGNKYRVISARRASKTERRIYYENKK